MIETALPAPRPSLPSPPKPGSIVGAFILIVILAGFLACAAGVAMLVVPGPAMTAKTIVIPQRSGGREIGKILAENGIVYDRWQFALPARLLAHGKLRPGEYEFAPQLTILDILALLQSGNTIVHKISIPEGLTAVEIAGLLKAEAALAGAIKDIPQEGSLLPETYHFSRNDARADMIARMQKLAAAALAEFWQKRAPGLPFATPEEARVLASIVEKETARPEERPRIAGVFINRLRQGIKLQSDPTTIYALTNGKSALNRPLTYADLAVASPYNTYAVAGLPPAPIANPGRAALQAVLNPEKHDYLYFVADGSGGHVFAKTLDEHNANVARWRKLQEH